MLIGVIDLGAQPTGVPLLLDVGVAPPLGTETLVLSAEAPAAGLSTQQGCSFQVEPPARPCDCSPGERCVAGSCALQGNAVYCCPDATCPPERLPGARRRLRSLPTLSGVRVGGPPAASLVLNTYSQVMPVLQHGVANSPTHWPQAGMQCAGNRAVGEKRPSARG
jgi:hypothetical protein